MPNDDARDFDEPGAGKVAKNGSGARFAFFGQGKTWKREETRCQDC